MRTLLLAVSASLTLFAHAPAQAADAANGLVIAKRWCAECHIVSPEQTTGKADVPSFVEVASRWTASPGGPLQKFLMNPHPRMPDMQIGRREADDLVAYISSLKK